MTPKPLEMVLIQPGTFTMGSPISEAGRYPREGPQTQVTISRGFWLGKYEITQGQWEAVTGTTPWVGKPYVEPDPGRVRGDGCHVELQRMNSATLSRTSSKLRT